MHTVDPPDTPCSHYLDLCPSAYQLGDDGAYGIRLDWSRSRSLLEGYGVYTIFVELLNQLAVRAVRHGFREDVRPGLRFIPASIRDLRIDDLGVTSRLIARAEKVGGFYRVAILGKNSDSKETKLEALIYVAQVGETKSC
ncbi:hypothetical protein [Agrobacterium rosae]|uniref:hypothetical protein n=1 Tax=Agrobacterium rosae TaxID=1972867 RepID=UPI003A7FA9D0